MIVTRNYILLSDEITYTSIEPSKGLKHNNSVHGGFVEFLKKPQLATAAADGDAEDAAEEAAM